jgi:DNA ligase-1
MKYASSRLVFSTVPLLCLLTGLLLSSACRAEDPTKPDLLLANVYRQGVDLSQYWVSEKLDGVRAYWDGSRFISRQGNPYAAPEWFTRGFPQIPLDGELWAGRERFQQLVGTVRKLQPDDDEWRRVRFMVFDLPDGEGDFSRRLQDLQRLFAEIDSPYIQLVRQERVTDHRQLMQRLARMVEAGGEGLMLHRAGAAYRGGRSDDLLKVKPYRDAEARVVAHLPGQGKYTGLLGALLVETPEGRRFRIGTGFSDAERASPPPIGCLVTYQYHGLTDSGIPRFPSFLRVREE